MAAGGNLGAGAAQGVRLLGAAVLVAAVAVLLWLVLPRTLGAYYLHVTNVTLVNILLALGLNFSVGFGGQISLAQAAFFGVGAYTYSLLQKQGLAWPLAASAAVLFSVAAGLLIAAPTLRLRGHYLALVTLGFSLVVSELLTNLSSLTGGADGIMDIPGIGLAGDTVAMLPVLLGLTSVAFLLSVAFAQSPLGMRVRAFRDDSTAAQAAGINVAGLKMLLFVISAAYAGVAGVAYAWLFGYVSPNTFGWQTTFSYLAMVVVGGLGSSLGAVVGAILYVFVPEMLRFLQEAYFAVFGLAVIVIIVLSPGGLVGFARRAGTAMTSRLRQG